MTFVGLIIEDKTAVYLISMYISFIVTIDTYSRIMVERV